MALYGNPIVILDSDLLERNRFEPERPCRRPEREIAIPLGGVDEHGVSENRNFFRSQQHATSRTSRLRIQRPSWMIEHMGGSRADENALDLRTG